MPIVDGACRRELSLHARAMLHSLGVLHRRCTMRSQARSDPMREWVPATIMFTALAAASGAADAQRVERQGKDVVDAVCGSCHATGKDNAPRIGDAKAWSMRAAQGMTALTEHALKGIRNMPAHGGSPGLSDIEIERAITHMVNQSGGNWVEPLGGATPAAMRSSETIVQNQCAKCHEAGRDGAPQIGDRKAWTPRLKKGLDPLVASAIHGHGPMPARGGLPDLSDQEIRGAIVYMFNHGLPAAPPAVARALADPRHKRVAGTDVYLGMVRAEALRAAHAQAADATAMRGIPTGKGYYHLNISLADNKSRVPVTDAEVAVQVSDGMTVQSKPLGLIAANNAVSYGNYFRFASGSAYNITAEIRRPGVAVPLKASFDFKAP
jgi:cytochrome c5